MSRQETSARVAPAPASAPPLFHKRAGTAPGSRCNPPPDWWGKWKRPAPDAHAGTPRRTAAGCPAGFSPAHTAAAGWPPRGLLRPTSRLRSSLPTRDRRGTGHIKRPNHRPAPPPPQRRGWAPADRLAAPAPAIPAFSGSFVLPSPAASCGKANPLPGRQWAALRHDSYPSCHPFRKQAAALDSLRLLVEYFILSTPPFPTGA